MNELPDKIISRRTLLKGVVGITGLALASGAFTVNAQTKSTKASMKYQETPKGDQKCINCTLFIPGKSSMADGTCQVVEGSISPQGWCTAYTKKS